jgi:hypothetical protein
MSKGEVGCPDQVWKGAYPNAWATADVQRLRELAGQGISPGQAAKLLRRSESAVRNKAGLHGISFQRKMGVCPPS